MPESGPLGPVTATTRPCAGRLCSPRRAEGLKSYRGTLRTGGQHWSVQGASPWNPSILQLGLVFSFDQQSSRCKADHSSLSPPSHHHPVARRIVFLFGSFSHRDAPFTWAKISLPSIAQQSTNHPVIQSIVYLSPRGIADPASKLPINSRAPVGCASLEKALRPSDKPHTDSRGHTLPRSPSAASLGVSATASLCP